MKVGIITFHHVYNYGASLQCYALKEVVQSLGCEVEVVNYLGNGYYPPFREKIWDRELLSCVMSGKFRTAYFYYKKRRKLIKQKLHFYKSFDNFDKELPLSDKVSNAHEINEQKYDVIILGSDQIWTDAKKLDPVFWGEDLTASVISYAASGISSCEQTIYDDKLAKNFKAISVREKGLYMILKDRGINASVVLDPVLLVEKNRLDSILKISRITGDYILCYNLGRDTLVDDVSKKLSKEEQLPVIFLNAENGSYEYNGRCYSCEGPGGFIGLISKATFVVTNSFHGTVLSIVYHRKFYSTLYKNSLRVQNLLETFELLDYVVDKDLVLCKLKIDWKKVDSILDAMKKTSKDYLRNELNCKG